MQNEARNQKRDGECESSRGYIAGLMISMAAGLLALTIALSYAT